MEYYTDLETTGLNPEEDKILTLQYQPLDKDGNPAGNLVILKEWEIGEEELIKRFLYIFKKWEFIPVGMNLAFDFKFLFAKIKKYTGKEIDLNELGNIPHLDIKPILVLMNGGNFKGAKLSNFTSKGQNGIAIPEYYKNKEYGKIIGYVEKEADEFIKFYKYLKQNLVLLKSKEVKNGLNWINEKRNVKKKI